MRSKIEQRYTIYIYIRYIHDIKRQSNLVNEVHAERDRAPPESIEFKAGLGVCEGVWVTSLQSVGKNGSPHRPDLDANLLVSLVPYLTNL